MNVHMRDQQGGALVSHAQAPAIEISNLERAYGAFKAVADVNISVPRGSFLVLVGPSGCGKSTMLRMLAGLETPTGGSIAFEGQEVASGSRGIIRGPADRDCGLVFQSYALWPHMTVAANVEWPLKVARWSGTDRKARVAEVLKLMAIDHLAERFPNEISGGQQQRVAIARMIAPRPKILLFDEPLSNLDAKLRVEMRTELMRVHRATGATSVYVTHDQVEALTMATHVAVLKDGCVDQFGSPDELLRNPQTAFVATFIGTPPANLVPVTAADGSWIFAGVRLGPSQGNGSAQLMYRAERIGIASHDREDVVRAEVVESVPLAGRTMVTALAGETRLTAVIDQAHRFAIGEPIGILLPSDPDGVFDEKGFRRS
jgi:iron(III) transport system ATP-binding protein